MAANYREIQNTFSKGQKIKQFEFLERDALNVEYLWKSYCLFTSDFIASCFVLSLYFPAKLSYELHSVNALNRYRFSRY